MKVFSVVVVVFFFELPLSWSVAVASIAVAPGALAGWYSLPFPRHSTEAGVCGPSHLFWVLAGVFAGGRCLRGWGGGGDGGSGARLSLGRDYRISSTLQREERQGDDKNQEVTYSSHKAAAVRPAEWIQLPLVPPPPSPPRDWA